MFICKLYIWCLPIFVGCAIISVNGDASEFFPSGDLTNVTWAHAVNSKAKLQEALQNPGVRMLEADIVMGAIIGTEIRYTPIMAHPPAVQSDLSFQEFITTVVEFNEGKSLESRKGVKLDFKTIVAVERVVKSIQALQITDFPVWLNADILKGPGGFPFPIPATKFIELCQQYLPTNTLSIGWTTGGNEEGRKLLTFGINIE